MSCSPTRWAGFGLQRGGDDAGSGSGALTATFRYFVVTHDRTNVRWYVNGALRSTHAAAFPASTDATNLQIGKGDFYGNNDLDEVAIYGAR